MIARGTMIKVKPIEILGDKVYVRNSIRRIEETGENAFAGWEYDEEELSLLEYLERTTANIDYIAIMTGVDL